MSIKAVLFDLDGTLLPMDQDAFTRGYFNLLAGKLAPRGYDPAALVDGIWKGTAAMVRNDGSCSNEEAFWRCFAAIYGEQVREDLPVFEEFYAQEFQQSKHFCSFEPTAAELVRALKNAGIRVILATNPIFPQIATDSRIRWAGLEPEDFELYTTYENTGYCKPNPAYYTDILKRQGLLPEECIMVGNDVDEDMKPAASLGLKVFLLTDCMLNRSDSDISCYPQGDFAELREWLSSQI